MATQYKVHSAAVNTTAAPVRIATGTAIKTLLQVTAGSARAITIISWEISFDGVTASAVPVPVELIETTTVAGTGGTSVTTTLWGLGRDASQATAAFAPSAEGTVSGTTRLLDYVDLSPNGGVYVRDFPLGREPVVLGSQVLRIRTTSAATVNAVCSITWEE
jgi:hypothetical protein